MLNLQDTVLVVIDVQGTLAQIIHKKEMLFDSLKKIIKGAKALEIPILWLEQIPENLGATTPEIADLLTHTQPISKFTFSACRNDKFMEAFKNVKRNQVLLTGIETHICVYQTAVDMLKSGYEVHLITDAVSSRTPENKEIGITKIKDAGGILTSVETALFEIMKDAKVPGFKKIINIVK